MLLNGVVFPFGSLVLLVPSVDDVAFVSPVPSVSLVIALNQFAHSCKRTNEPICIHVRTFIDDACQQMEANCRKRSLDSPFRGNAKNNFEKNEKKNETNDNPDIFHSYDSRRLR